MVSGPVGCWASRSLGSWVGLLGWRCGWVPEPLGLLGPWADGLLDSWIAGGGPKDTDRKQKRQNSTIRKTTSLGGGMGGYTHLVAVAVEVPKWWPGDGAETSPAGVEGKTETEKAFVSGHCTAGSFTVGS